jgi:hypothetical protein
MNPVILTAAAAGLGFAAGLLAWRTRRRVIAPRAGASGASPADRRTDEALLETFPASDPPAAMGSLVSGSPGRRTGGHV